MVERFNKFTKFIKIKINKIIRHILEFSKKLKKKIKSANLIKGRPFNAECGKKLRKTAKSFLKF